MSDTGLALNYLWRQQDATHYPSSGLYESSWSSIQCTPHNWHCDKCDCQLDILLCIGVSSKRLKNPYSRCYQGSNLGFGNGFQRHQYQNPK